MTRTFSLSRALCRPGDATGRILAYPGAAALLIAHLVAAPSVRAECHDYSEHLHWIASLPDPGGVMGVAIAGDYAYVAASDSGMYVVDISDPHQPVRAARADTPGSASDIAIGNGYAYIADLFSGLQIIDIRDPIHPVLVAGLDTALPAVSVAVAGPAVYVGEANLPFYGSSRLEVVDATLPAAPEAVAWLMTPSWVWDIALSGNSAYLAIEDRGLMRVDITDPFDPGADGVLDLFGNAQGVTVDGEFVYVGDGPGGLHVVRSREGYPLEWIGAVDTPGSANGLALYGSYLCIADGTEGFSIADLSNPTAPVIVGTHATPWTCWNVAVRGTTAYVADQYSLECFDLAVEPSMVAPLTTVDGVEAVDVATQDTLACIACISQGLKVFSIADPVHPRQLSVVTPPGDQEGVEVRGELAFTANWGGGISITSIADPSQPEILGTASVAGPAWDLDVEGSYAYVAASDLFIVDVSDPTNPAVVSGVQTSPERRARRVDVSGSYAYVTDETTGLAIVDVSVPTAPQLIRTVSISGGAYAVTVRGSHAYVSGKNKRFYVMDVSVPGQAFITGSAQLSVYGMRFAVDDRYVYVASVWAKGLHIVDVGDPAAPRITGELLTMGGGQGIDIANGYVYLADQPYLTVAALHCPSPLSDVPEPEFASPRGEIALSARPSPSHGPVRLAFDLPAGGAPSLSVHDGQGRLVRRLAGIAGSTGEQFIEWDGRDGDGLPVANGAYFARLAAGGRVGSTRIILLR
jgi:hypothetical protein